MPHRSIAPARPRRNTKQRSQHIQQKTQNEARTTFNWKNLVYRDDEEMLDQK